MACMDKADTKAWPQRPWLAGLAWSQQVKQRGEEFSQKTCKAQPMALNKQ